VVMAEIMALCAAFLTGCAASGKLWFALGRLGISNPPFHDGLQTSLEAAQALIRGAVRHLNSGGELRIVANAFLPYPQVLDETFGFHEVIAQTGRFKVYRTIMTRQAKK
ncbi:methyltransferase, partial [Klebsiella quasipneumoniae]